MRSFGREGCGESRSTEDPLALTPTPNRNEGNTREDSVDLVSDCDPPYCVFLAKYLLAHSCMPRSATWLLQIPQTQRALTRRQRPLELPINRACTGESR